MSEKKKTTYVPKPEVPESVRLRYETVLAVIAGQKTQEQAATELGLSRLRFQTLLHRSLGAMLTALGPGEAGRPAKPAREKALEEEAVRLRRQNERLQERTQMIDRLLGVAGEMLRGQRTTSGAPIKSKARQAKTKAVKIPTPGDGDEDPEPGALVRRQLCAVEAMMKIGVRQDVAAKLAGTSAATVRRWALRRCLGQIMRRRPGPQVRHATPEALADAERRVRELHGLVGAESLSHSTGLTRRRAAAVKRQTLTTMERERQSRCGRVTVLRPGIMRGFDQLVLPTWRGLLYALIGADAAVPYRTSVYLTWTYDSTSVAAAIEQDIALNGAPLVWRMDRCAAHRTAEVRNVLEHHGAVTLHGPARHPQYYGQLERQNREHRAWLEKADRHPVDDPTVIREQMVSALNGLWCRPSLGWRTAEEAWVSRPTLTEEERDQFRVEVYDRLARIEDDRDRKRRDADGAMRLALEQALHEQGYLTVNWGRGAS